MSQPLFLAVPFLDGIYVAQADGSSLTRLANVEGRDHTWSPDGQTIAFVSWRYEIYTMKTDGSNLTRLTDNTARDLAPAWSPDGQHIVFTENYDTIYLMDTGGKNVTKLPIPLTSSSYSPAWQPSSPPTNGRDK